MAGGGVIDQATSAISTVRAHCMLQPIMHAQRRLACACMLHLMLHPVSNWGPVAICMP